MSDTPLNRRDFVLRLLIGGAAASQAVVLLSACQSSSAAATRPDRASKDEVEEGADPVEQQQESVEDRVVDEAETSPASDDSDASNSDTSTELDCTDTEGLSKAEIKVRESLKYTDESPKPDQFCDNCALWKPADSENSCGGCQIMAGPIHPKGWCTAWAPA
ncbi:MAG: high-potential iron-sulfur protein [Myxococcota bacterium]